VLVPAQLANLPAGKVVVFRRGMAPAVGTVRMAWNRRDVRGQAKPARSEPRVISAAARAGELGDVLPPPAPVRATATREAPDGGR